MKQIKNDNCIITMYDGLMDFINENKKSFPTNHDLKSNVEFSDGVFIYDNTFDDEWHDFISYYINELKLNKNDDNIKLHFYSDGIFTYEIKIYNNNSLIGHYECL